MIEGQPLSLSVSEIESIVESFLTARGERWTSEKQITKLVEIVDAIRF